MTPDDLPASPDATRRRATLAAMFGLAAVGGNANAQMGGGGGGGRHGGGQERPPVDKDRKDDHAADAGLPRDLMAAFARRLREGVPELALAPPQQKPFGEFVGCVHEVGEHNERRLQRIFWRSAASVSAVSPLKSFIGAEVDEGEGRQDALAELKVAFDKLDAVLDDRQRSVLANLFVATRSELQTPREQR